MQMCRPKLIEATGCLDLNRIVGQKETAWAAARWLLDTNLEQFRIAKETEREHMTGWRPFQMD